jgi:hypothetical protein
MAGQRGERGIAAGHFAREFTDAAASILAKMGRLPLAWAAFVPIIAAQ